jgi:hypothetical protein
MATHITPTVNTESEARVKMYDRWLGSPQDEMPYWLRRVISLVAGVAGIIVAGVLGSELGTRLVLLAVVAGGMHLGVRIVWRVTHRETSDRRVSAER